MAEEQNCDGGPELCRSEPVETRLQIQVIIIYSMEFQIHEIV